MINEWKTVIGQIKKQDDQNREWDMGHEDMMAWAKMRKRGKRKE